MRFILTALILAATVTPARADWNKTTWEMTSAQVADATGSRIVPQEGRGHRLGAEGDYEALEYAFRARYYFDEADRLRQVRLELKQTSDCQSLWSTLQGLYGQPNTLRSDVGTWTTASLDEVRLITPGPSSPGCVLVYSPLRTTGAAGL